MSGLRAFWSRVIDAVSLVGRRRERQLEDEVESHLQHLADDFERQGMAPQTARLAARRAFGGIEQIKERYRDQRGLPILARLVGDLRSAARALRAGPAALTLALVTLALGIGVANTAFLLMNALCIRGLPIDEPDRVVSVSTLTANGQMGGLSVRDREDLGRVGGTIDGLQAYVAGRFVVGGVDRAPERVSAAFVSAGAFDVLGERPVVGRGFGASDELPGAPPVALVGDGLWRRLADGDPASVGRTVKIDGEVVRVIGVMAPGFRFPGTADLWRPLTAWPVLRVGEGVDRRSLSVFGRLSAGASIDDARREIAAIAAARSGPAAGASRPVFQVVPINDRFNGDLTATVWLAFMTAGALVLVVACANVANLLLMRGSARGHEMAVRLAMGATRGRLFRQLVLEHALLGGMAGALGLALSCGAGALLQWSVPASLPLPYWVRFTIDARVLALLVLVSIGSVMLSGLVPAWQASSLHTADALRGRDASGPRAVRTRRFTTAFVAVEIALAFVLLSNVAWAVRQSWRPDQTDAAIDRSVLLSARLTLPAPAYDAESRLRFYSNLTERLTSVDGIADATIASRMPLGGGDPFQLVTSVAATSGGSLPRVYVVSIGPDYFRTIGIAVTRGRTFDQMDGLGARQTAIVNSRLARGFFGDADAIGQRIRLVPDGGDPGAAPWQQIVGIVPSIEQRGPLTPDPMVYVPLPSAAPSAVALIVRRVEGDPGVLAAPVREIARGLDADLPLERVMTMAQDAWESGWNGRISNAIINAFSWLAVAMGLVGLYAVTSYAVARRTREMGIRITLGAGRRRVAWLVLRRVVGQLGAGLALGLVLTLAFHSRFSDASAADSPTDPMLLVPLAALVALTGIAARLGPVLRATRLDPASTLRFE